MHYFLKEMDLSRPHFRSGQKFYTIKEFMRLTDEQYRKFGILCIFPSQTALCILDQILWLFLLLLCSQKTQTTSQVGALVRLDICRRKERFINTVITLVFYTCKALKDNVIFYCQTNKRKRYFTFKLTSFIC